MDGCNTAPSVLTIQGPGSWRSRALNLVLRLASGSALDPDADFAALRETYERMDARCFPLHRSVCREPADCDGVPAHWVSVPQSLPGRTVFVGDSAGGTLSLVTLNRILRNQEPLQAGSTELLRDEALRVADKAHAAGVDVEVELWPSVPHAFQLAAFLPEAAKAMERITAFVVARTGWRV